MARRLKRLVALRAQESRARRGTPMASEREAYVYIRLPGAVRDASPDARGGDNRSNPIRGAVKPTCRYT